jgi:hypothetical protein
MPQIFPNFVNTTPESAQPAPIQTKRVSGTGTGADQQVAITWDVPFADTNYTVSLAIETTAGVTYQNNPFLVENFTKSTTGLVVTVNCPNTLTYVLHAVALSDHA